jgi:hypothetical protein
MPRKYNLSPEARAALIHRAAERMRKLNADPEFAKAHAERMRKLHADPEFAKAHAERMRKLHAKKRGFDIPEWVPSEYRQLFCDLVKEKHLDFALRRIRIILDKNEAA